MPGSEAQFRLGEGAWRNPAGRNCRRRVFSGRAGRSLATDYVRAAMEPNAPAPAPYPVQRGLTAAMRAAATQNNDVQRMQAWAGQSAAMAQARPAAEIVKLCWEGAQAILS